MMTISKLLCSLFIILQSINSYAENIIQQMSDEVKVEYSLDGLVNIYSTHQGKPNHHYNLKLKSMGYGENLIHFSSPKPLVINKSVPSYDWGNGIVEEWKLGKNSLQQIITINKKPALVKGNNNLIIRYFNNTDLQILCVGNSCYYNNEKSNNPTSNLSIDANIFAVTDDNCVQIRANKYFNYQNNTMIYSFDDSKAKFPVTIKHTIKANRIDEPKIKAIAVDNDSLAVSYINQQNVVLYERINNDWHYKTTIKSVFNNSKWGEFGGSLALSGKTLVIAATDIGSIDENSDCSDCTMIAVHVYVKENNSWILQARLFASSTDEYSRFGDSIDIDGDILVVGDTNSISSQVNNGNNKNSVNDTNGAVYVFQRTNNQWKEIAVLAQKETSSEGSFGDSVAIHNDTIVVGGSYVQKIKDVETHRTKWLDYGQFTIFEKGGSKWKQNSHIKFQDIEKNPSEFNRYFARSIDIHDDVIVVGNPLEFFDGIRGYGLIENINEDIDKSGSVYVFKKTNNKWRKQKKLKPSNSLQLDHFGSSVKIHNKTLVVGAYGESSNSSGINNDMDNCQLASSGAVYVFNKKWNGWKQTDYIKASNPSEFDMFGMYIDYEGETLAVGVSELYIFSNKEASRKIAVEKNTSKKKKQWQQEIKY